MKVLANIMIALLIAGVSFLFFLWGAVLQRDGHLEALWEMRPSPSQHDPGQALGEADLAAALEAERARKEAERAADRDTEERRQLISEEDSKTIDRLQSGDRLEVVQKEMQGTIGVLMRDLALANAELKATREKLKEAEALVLLVREELKDAKRQSEGRAETERVLALFLTQLDRDFATYDDAAVITRLGLAGVHFDYTVHPRTGYPVPAVSVQSALVWARRWMNRGDYELLDKTVDKSKSIYFVRGSIEAL